MSGETQPVNCFEVNFDGLVGPTHNYAGLAFGNVASAKHGGASSSPKQAALQGLEKMWALHRMGMTQAVLPPHERPNIKLLKQLGFQGKNESDVLRSAQKQAPNLLAAAASAASMWVANAATVSPFADTADNKTHFTPANLSSMLHRSIESPTTARILQTIFAGESFVHHSALPVSPAFSDEGAANHTRLCQDYGAAGVGLFVYGCAAQGDERPQKFPARQTLEASQSIARQHQLAKSKVVFAQQNPAAIDAGVFHNDVIAVGNANVLLYHERAFLHTAQLRDDLQTAMDGELHFIEVPDDQVSLDEAVQSYLFNSQLILRPDKSAASLIVPIECQESASVHDYLQSLVADHPAIDEVCYFDLRQSMNNGGGPACLRLRVVMSEQQIDDLDSRVILDEALYGTLRNWVEKFYRDELAPEDLADPALLSECRTALDELSQILALGSVYEFQR